MTATIGRYLAAGALAIGLSVPHMAAAETLRIAVLDEPSTLDQQVVTSDLSTTIAQHVFEGLYTFDASYAPVPMLASGEEILDDGKTIVINLREGVTFHDGSDFNAEDAVASLQRWGEHGSRGGLLFDTLESVEATGEHQVTLKFSQVFGPWKNLLAFINGGPVMFPKEVMDGAGADPVDQAGYIGTGPYQFAEWNPNRFIEVTRFDGYAARDEAADGYGGKREALADTIRFIPVPDVGTRVSGLRAGDYDYAVSIPGDLFEELDQSADARTVVNQGPIFPLVFMNSKEGMLAGNSAMRHAILAALNMEDAMRVAVGPESLWSTNGSFLPEGNTWFTDSGTELFNQSDIEKAKSLAAEAGYDGEPIRFMVSNRFPIHFDSATVFARQLANAGFNVDLQIFDWATLVNRRGQSDLWDMFFTHHGFVPDPVLVSFMSDSYPGWWASEQKSDLLRQFNGTTDDATRQALWQEIQALVYEDIPALKTGDVFTYDIVSPALTGIGETSLIWPRFWDVTRAN